MQSEIRLQQTQNDKNVDTLFLVKVRPQGIYSCKNHAKSMCGASAGENVSNIKRLRASHMRMYVYFYFIFVATTKT